jgi:hypothetical protein
MLNMCLVDCVFLQANSCPISKIKSIRHKCVSQERREEETIVCNNLRIWGCQCFLVIPPDLRVKGGPHQYEAMFVGYEENCIGWRVCDLKGKYHFSGNITFNKSAPGHLSPHRGEPIDFD